MSSPSAVFPHKKRYLSPAADTAMGDGDGDGDGERDRIGGIP